MNRFHASYWIGFGWLNRNFFFAFLCIDRGDESDINITLLQWLHDNIVQTLFDLIDVLPVCVSKDFTLNIFKIAKTHTHTHTTLVPTWQVIFCWLYHIIWNELLYCFSPDDSFLFFFLKVEKVVGGEGEYSLNVRWWLSWRMMLLCVLFCRQGYVVVV
jgi:hypothetical protein